VSGKYHYQAGVTGILFLRKQILMSIILNTTKVYENLLPKNK
jgi:hypothetical protein